MQNFGDTASPEQTSTSLPKQEDPSEPCDYAQPEQQTLSPKRMATEQRQQVLRHWCCDPHPWREALMKVMNILSPCQFEPDLQTPNPESWGKDINDHYEEQPVPSYSVLYHIIATLPSLENEYNGIDVHKEVSDGQNDTV
jgi:hypothetical protein